jgi:hypothetical protein
MANDFSGDARHIDLTDSADFIYVSQSELDRTDFTEFCIFFDPMTLELMDWFRANGGIRKVLCGQ